MNQELIQYQSERIAALMDELKIQEEGTILCTNLGLLSQSERIIFGNY